MSMQKLNQMDKKDKVDFETRSFVLFVSLTAKGTNHKREKLRFYDCR